MATEAPEKQPRQKRGRAANASKQTGKQRQAQQNGNKRGPKGPMTEEHKAALAAGREQGRAVSAYLDALDSHKPKRGRRVTVESTQAKLDKVKAEIASASPGDRLVLIQTRMNLEATLERLSNDAGTNIKTLEEGFVKVAKDYAGRKGITKAAFREFGVPAEVLKRAGV